MAFNATGQILPALNRTAANRQPRFGYIPLFSLLLANILSNSALAKYAPLGALRVSYEPLPWIQKPNQPLTHDSYHYWDPASNPYAPPTPSGSSDSTDTHIHHHHHLPSANQQQIVNIHERPTEIIIADTDTESTEQNETASPFVITDEIVPIPALRNSLEKSNVKEPVAAESRSVLPQLLAFLSNTTTTPSSKKVKRGTSKYLKMRKNNKYISQKKRRPTTTPEYYYDNYEEDTTTTKRYQPKRYTSKYTKIPKVDSYEGSESSISNSYDISDISGVEDDYEYYEYTTKPQKKRRRTTTSTHRPKRYKNKYRNRKPTNLDYYDNIEYDTERIIPSTTTQSLKVQHQELLLRQQEQLLRQQHQLQRQQEFLQRQQQTTTEETTTSGATTPTTLSTTTAPTTTTGLTFIGPGNITGLGNNTGNNTGGYGYGPSNGYEGISITYSPSGIGSNPGGSPAYVAPSPVYTSPSQSYNAPNPSYGPPKPSYGPPSNSYGTPSSSGLNPSVNGYYQVPFNDWYSNEVNRNSIVKKVHDIIGFDNVFH